MAESVTPGKLDDMRPVRGAVLLGVVLTLSSCSEGTRCGPTDAGVAPGLNVEVLDEQGPVCDATVTAVDGDYSDTFRKVGATTDCRYLGVFGRAGTYTITIMSGEKSKTVTDVIVERDACNFTGRMLTVMLD